MADPGKDKKRTKIQIEHGNLIFGPQQKHQQNITSYPSLLLLQTRPNTKDTEIKHTYKQTQTYRLHRRMADPGKDKKRTKIKNRTWKINIRTSTKTTTKYNILPFPSFITNKTQHKRNANQAHTKTNTNLPSAQKNGRSR